MGEVLPWGGFIPGHWCSIEIVEVQLSSMEDKRFIGIYKAIAKHSVSIQIHS